MYVCALNSGHRLRYQLQLIRGPLQFPETNLGRSCGGLFLTIIMTNTIIAVHMISIPPTTPPTTPPRVDVGKPGACIGRVLLTIKQDNEKR